MLRLGLLLCLLAAPVFAATSSLTLDELKMQKRFGIGLAAGGGLAVMGLEVDFNLTETFSMTGGIGTGVDYSTFNVKARYYMPGKWVSPYIGAGFARWWSGGTDAKQIGPSVLANKFIDPGQDLRQGFSVFILYPTLGVQFMHAMGFSVSGEVMYLFKVPDFANGTYAGLSAHWYF